MAAVATRLAGLAFALSLCLSASTQSPDKLEPQGFVNDFAGILNSQTKEQLTALCQEINRKAAAQLSVVTIRTTGGIPIDEYSIDLAQRWGIGPKKGDRGAMILLVINDHRYRIEVGYGLEGILPDGKVGTIGREAVPLLRKGDYNQALLLMTSRVANVIAADRHVSLTTAPAFPRASESGPEGEFPVGTLLFLLFFFGMPLAGWLIPLILSGVLTNPANRRRYLGRRPWMFGGYWPGTWTGGGFGGGGSGWGGGGGFGGFGGGSFGGGGASGSW